MSEANKAFIRRFVEEVQNQHNVAAMDEFFAPSFVNYDIVAGLPDTLEGSKQLHRMLFAALPDLQMTIHDQAAEGDKVWTRKTPRARTKESYSASPRRGNPSRGKSSIS